MNSRSPSRPKPRLTGEIVAVGQIGRQLALIAPERPAGARVERPRVVERTGHVHDAVGHERRPLEPSARDDAGLEGPLRREAMRVLRRDLLERTVTLAAVVAGEIQPARRILVALEQILKGDAATRRSPARRGALRPAAARHDGASRRCDRRDMRIRFLSSSRPRPRAAAPAGGRGRPRRSVFRNASRSSRSRVAQACPARTPASARSCRGSLPAGWTSDSPAAARACP